MILYFQKKKKKEENNSSKHTRQGKETLADDGSTDRQSDRQNR